MNQEKQWLCVTVVNHISMDSGIGNLRSGGPCHSISFGPPKELLRRVTERLWVPAFALPQYLPP